MIELKLNSTTANFVAYRPEYNGIIGRTSEIRDYVKTTFNGDYSIEVGYGMIKFQTETDLIFFLLHVDGN